MPAKRADARRAVEGRLPPPLDRHHESGVPGIAARVRGLARDDGPTDPEAAAGLRGAPHRDHSVPVVLCGDSEPHAGRLAVLRGSHRLVCRTGECRSRSVELEARHAEGSPPRLGPAPLVCRPCSEAALDRTAPRCPGVDPIAAGDRVGLCLVVDRLLLGDAPTRREREVDLSLPRYDEAARGGECLAEAVWTRGRPKSDRELVLLGDGAQPGDEARSGARCALASRRGRTGTEVRVQPQLCRRSSPVANLELPVVAAAPAAPSRTPSPAKTTTVRRPRGRPRSSLTPRPRGGSGHLVVSAAVGALPVADHARSLMAGWLVSSGNTSAKGCAKRGARSTILGVAASCRDPRGSSCLICARRERTRGERAGATGVEPGLYTS